VQSDSNPQPSVLVSDCRCVLHHHRRLRVRIPLATARARDATRALPSPNTNPNPNRWLAQELDAQKEASSKRQRSADAELLSTLQDYDLHGELGYSSQATLDQAPGEATLDQTQAAEDERSYEGGGKVHRFEGNALVGQPDTLMRDIDGDLNVNGRLFAHAVVLAGADTAELYRKANPDESLVACQVVGLGPGPTVSKHTEGAQHVGVVSTLASSARAPPCALTRRQAHPATAWCRSCGLAGWAKSRSW
jgi:hypothetical protein